MKARSAVLLATVLSLALFGIAACSGGSSKRFIPPPPTTVGQVTTAPPASDYSDVQLDPVPGTPTTEAVPVLGGDAALSGVVLGPDGPVQGATVRLERFVGDAIGRIDVTTDGGGSWKAPQAVVPPSFSPTPSLPDTTFPGQLPTIPSTTTTTRPPTPVTPPRIGPQGILGGRYRVRAWRTPDLALTTPQILFLEAKQNKQVPLQLTRFTGTTASSVSSPDPPVLGSLVNLTAIVSSASVDADGVVRSVPAAGASVTLSLGAGLLLLGGPTTTNAQGRATFQLQCQALGQSTADLTVNAAQTFSLPLRACVAPPSTTSSLPFDPNSTSPTLFPGGPTSSSTPGPPIT